MKFVLQIIKRRIFLILTLSVFTASNLFAFQQLADQKNTLSTIDTVDCGQFRTQTQGGWGTNAAGNNPGVYRDANFENAFPNGLSIGCQYTLTLSTSAAVKNFLPSGSTAAAFTENLIDPNNYNNVLAGQLVALRLSVAFDDIDEDFSPSEVNLGDMIVSSGNFEGWSVYEILDEANSFIGACDSDYSASDLNEVLSSINENYVDGTMDGGFLDCPEDEVEEVLCSIELTNSTNYCNEDADSYTVEVTIDGSNGTFIVEDANALTGSGDYVCLGDSNDISSVITHTFILTYEISTSYSISVSTLIPSIDNCAEATNSSDCYLDPIIGNPPVCCEFSVICPDQTVFTFSCLDDIPVADTSLISYSNNCGPVTINVNENISGQGCVSDPYYLNRTYEISDGSSTFSCTYNYITIDSSPPVISCPADENATCDAEEIEPQVWATAYDNCDDDVEIYYSDDFTGSCDSFLRTWTAIDDCGNSSSCTQTVFITDDTPPVLILPADASVDCLSEIVPSITGDASASDVCSEVSLTYEDGEWIGEECMASLIRTWTATDACGNSVSGEQTIIREDNVAPLLIGVPGGGNMQCGDFPEPPLVSAYDQCQEDSVEVIMTETMLGEGCNRGILRTWTATDICGNIATQTRPYFIRDTQAPIITCPDSIILNCGDPVPDTTSAGVASAFDNCSEDIVTITFFDGPLNNDCPPSIHRTWSATDTCGNTSSCIQVISFIDTEAPIVECIDDISIDCSMGDTSPLFTGMPNVLDDCSNVTLDYSDGEYSGDCPVSFIRTWIASDACGNTTVCEQTITVIDEMAPNIYCPADKTVECGTSTSPENTGMAAAYDNCLSVSVSYSDGDISGACPQTFVRTWTATDYCGNTSTCDQNIYINDNTAPVIVCPEEISISCLVENIDAEIGVPEVIDACSSTSISYTETPVQGDCPQYFYRLWIAMDECGNTSQCSQLIYLVDETGPELTCPEDITINCDDDSNPEFTGQANATDACSEFEITYLDSLVSTSTGNSTGTCGQFRTQTQGGWGTRASGSNPGTYRDANFEDAFPNGLVVGCDFKLTLSSSINVEEFLPAGGTASMLQIDMLNPVGYGNVLAGQLVALTLSVGFDNYDEDFSEASNSLSALIIGNGLFAGWTVSEILTEANLYFGGCESAYSASELNSVLSSINENFVDGSSDNGFLICNEVEDDCYTIYRTWIAVDACGNETECTQVITASSETTVFGSNLDVLKTALVAYPTPTLGDIKINSKDGINSGDRIELIDIAGHSLMTYIVNSPGEQSMDLSDVKDGIYILQLTSEDEVLSVRIIKN